jgi:D-serine deaminase-like pyridoxal phosphate-dependent protein
MGAAEHERERRAYPPAVPLQPLSGPVEVPPLPADLDTPTLVVFVDRVVANIERLQHSLDLRGVRLRPHAKTHKSVHIGRLQLEAGASGLTVGTLGEAEVFALAGLRDLFIAYPVWAEGPKASRLRALHDSVDLRVGVDSVAGAERLAAAVHGSRRPLRILVELDSGGHRTGVATSGDAAEVATAASRAGLEVEGVFTHGGHSYRPGAAGAAAADEATTLEAGARALEAAGFEARTISAGSTPTRALAAQGRVNEIRAGTYVLGDRQQWALGAIEAEGIAAVVAATVVSVAPGRFVIDAGAKALTKDLPAFVAGYGFLPRWPTAVIERVNDYHGTVSLPGGEAGPRLGDVVAVVPNHVCPVVDLAASFVAVLPDGRTEQWPVDARGRNA